MADEKKPVASKSTLFLKSKDTHIIDRSGNYIKIHREPQTKAQTANDEPGKILGITLQFEGHKYELSATDPVGREDIEATADFFGVVLG